MLQTTSKVPAPNHYFPMSETEQPSLIRAAAYVRMSTEHQQYSTSNQMDAIKEYAAHRGMEIVKTYSDEGKSGLNIQGRDSLGQMIADVQAKTTDFACILVYDVSRWLRGFRWLGFCSWSCWENPTGAVRRARRKAG